MKWRSHLYRIAACDIFLDNFIYGAHTTAADILWQWVPMVTLAGVRVIIVIITGTGYGFQGKMSSRVASSLLQSLGGDSTHLIAHTIKEYEDLVIRYD